MKRFNDLETLGMECRHLRVGDRVMLDNTYASLWPNPAFPREDDYIEPPERAARWAHRRGLTIREQFDPSGLVIEYPGNAVFLDGGPEHGKIVGWDGGDRMEVAERPEMRFSNFAHPLAARNLTFKRGWYIRSSTRPQVMEWQGWE